MNISKELLAEIQDLDELNYPHSIEVKNNMLFYKTGGQIMDKHINIYEFASKCKTWAFGWKYNIPVLISSRESSYGKYYASAERINIAVEVKMFTNFDTEHEAILEACEWILKEKI